MLRWVRCSGSRPAPSWSSKPQLARYPDQHWQVNARSAFSLRQVLCFPDSSHAAETLAGPVGSIEITRSNQEGQRGQLPWAIGRRQLRGTCHPRKEAVLIVATQPNQLIVCTHAVSTIEQEIGNHENHGELVCCARSRNEHAASNSLRALPHRGINAPPVLVDNVATRPRKKDGDESDVSSLPAVLWLERTLLLADGTRESNSRYEQRDSRWSGLANLPGRHHQRRHASAGATAGYRDLGQREGAAVQVGVTTQGVWLRGEL